MLACWLPLIGYAAEVLFLVIYNAVNRYLSRLYVVAYIVSVLANAGFHVCSFSSCKFKIKNILEYSSKFSLNFVG